MLTFIGKSTTRTHLYTNAFPCQNMCFLRILTAFLQNTLSTKGVYVLSSASPADNNAGIDHIIGFDVYGWDNVTSSATSIQSNNSEMCRKRCCPRLAMQLPGTLGLSCGVKEILGTLLAVVIVLSCIVNKNSTESERQV